MQISSKQHLIGKKAVETLRGLARELRAVSQNGYPQDDITNVVVTRAKELGPGGYGSREVDWAEERVA